MRSRKRFDAYTLATLIMFSLLAVSCPEVALLNDLENLVNPPAGDPPISWAKTMGGNLSEGVNDVAATSDGGCLIAGWTTTYTCPGGGGKDAWAIRLDAEGGRVWEYSVGGSADDEFTACGESGDGYLFAGWTRSAGAGGVDLWAVRLGTAGQVTWQKTWGMASDENVQPGSTLVRKRGGCIFGGMTTSTLNHSGDYLLVRVDDEGSTVYSHYWENLGYYESILGVIEFSDDTLLLRKYGTNIPYGSAYIERTTTSYGTTAFSALVEYFMCLASDGGVVTVQQTSPTGFVARRYGNTMSRIGTDMAVSTAKAFYPVSIVEAPDGSFLVVGYTYWYDEYDYLHNEDIVLAKLGADLSATWVREYGGEGIDMPKAAAAMDDGGFVVAGTTTSWGGGGQDIWILRVDAAGDPALSPWVNESRDVEPDVGTGDPLPPLTVSGHADLGLVGVPTAFNAYETFAYSKVQE